MDRCEAVLTRIYDMAGTKRTYRPFRFPYGDKGQKNKDAFQSCLRERGFSKVNDTTIPYTWWRENGLDRDIDTLWTFDFTEYRIRPGSGYTMEDVWKRIRNPNPENGAALYMPEGRHILLFCSPPENHDHINDSGNSPGYAIIEAGKPARALTKNSRSNEPAANRVWGDTAMRRRIIICTKYR